MGFMVVSSYTSFVDAVIRIDRKCSAARQREADFGFVNKRLESIIRFVSSCCSLLRSDDARLVSGGSEEGGWSWRCFSGAVSV